MQVDYEDEDLELLAYESAYMTARWPPSVTKTYRRRLQQLEAVVNERDLCGLKALHVEKLNGDGKYSIRIQMQYRLIFRFDSDDSTRLVIMSAEPADYEQRSDSHGTATR